MNELQLEIQRLKDLVAKQHFELEEAKAEVQRLGTMLLEERNKNQKLQNNE